MRFWTTASLLALTLSAATAQEMSNGQQEYLNSCAVCHGAAGEGVGAGNPPLGGQPAGYIADQLRQWQLSQRRNDPGNLMLAISRQLTPAEVGAE